MKKRLINIIGMGDGWANAPYLGESWGACNLLLKRPCSRIIDMNDYSDNRWGDEETLHNQEVMLLCEAKNIPYIGLHNYPIKKIIEALKTDFFTNTIDYMIALAIYEHVHAINFYGVNMSTKSEYAFEQPGVNFWCGMAMGRGLEVKVFGEKSTIMKAPEGVLYGYYTLQESLEVR